jgi:LmbE family N-acetylglucosaminyl deacetylase
MRKVIFGIFAHPDDESFGPGGTLLKLCQDGYDLHLIVVTDGEAGVNIDTLPDLGATRLQEWQDAARILGARTTHALHFPDGTLDTIPLIELENAVVTAITNVLYTYTEPVTVSFMTFEPQGLTSHRDHIAVSEVVFRLAPRFEATELWYFCLDKSQAPLEGTAYYEPRAREDSYITTRVDVSAQLDDKYRLFDCHYSQRGDAESVKKLGDKLLSTECFHIDS